MSDWDMGCESSAAKLIAVDERIQQQIVIGQEILGELISPVVDGIDQLEKAKKKIGRRLIWGLEKDLETPEASAGYVINGINAGIDGEISRLDKLQFLVQASGNDARIASQSVQINVGNGNGESDPEGNAKALARAGYQPADLDHPHVLKFAESSQRWHEQLSAFYGEAMREFLIAPTLADMERQSAIRNRQLAESIAIKMPIRKLRNA